MKILLTGGSGLIGKELGKTLVREGHQIILIARNKKKALDQIAFPCEIIEADLNTTKAIPVPSIDGVIHLAGETISNRWTEKQKNKILKSRTQVTENLLSSLADQKLNFFLSASAIGFYGDSPDLKTENSAQGEGFLAEVVSAWENSIRNHKLNCKHTYIARFGVVLSKQGGALEKMKIPFQLGVGGKVGSGEQWLSWIHIDDLTQAIAHLIEKKCESGIYNLVAPEPIQNKNLTKELAQVFLGFHHFSAPKSVLKLALGEMSDLVLQSQNVSSQKLLSTHFKFQYPSLHDAFKNIFETELSNESEFYVEQFIPYPIETVFDFFKDANNLNKITPTDLDFKILNQSTSEIQQGTLFDYKIKINGIPANWRTEILKWNPPYQFVDNQVSGPYKKWYHIHSFEKLGDGTLMTDRVIYKAPLGILGKVFGSFYIKNQIKKIFSFRKIFINNYNFNNRS